MSDFGKGFLLGSLVQLTGFMLVVLLSACSTHTISITPGCVNATSSALLYCPEATVIRVVDGNRTVDMLSEASGVGAVVQGLGDNAVEVMRP